MRDFTVITDSTADISSEIAQERGITVVPLSVTFGEETLADGVLTQTEFFERMGAAPQLPKTSQPSVGAFVEAYERALAETEEVISIHISSRLSGTIGSALQAAERFAGKVHVFDSLNLSWGLALQVLDAARSAAEDISAAAALQRLERTRERAKMIVGVDSLENLKRGGRIGRVSSFLGAMLDLKVTFTVDGNGEFVPVRRDRGEKAALEHTLAWVADRMGDAKRGAFAVGYAMREERAQKLREALEAAYEVTEMFVYPAGSVISTHTGTGWSIALLPEA
ncbi:MAG: DegV family protein [Coriobacteriia bacterium]